MAFISYAQNFEDVMLWRALGHVDDGFYIDIGAQDPVVDSVSLAFYQQGWSGVSVEPTPQYADRMRQARPEETLEQVAIGSKKGIATMYAFPDTGLSTADAAVAAHHTEAGYKAVEFQINFISLSDLLSKYGSRNIHWLKIDVEGFEQSVLESWGNSPVRPWVLVVESTEPLTQNLTHGHWEPLVLAKNYQFAYFDGLNRFYVHHSHRDLLEKFKVPPNVFDGFRLGGEASNSFCDLLKEELRIAKKRGEDVEILDQRLSRVEDATASTADALGQIASLTERLLTANSQLARFQAEAVYWRDEAEGKKKALDQVQRLERKVVAYGAQQKRLHALEKECEALRQSLSWRLTASLRWLGGVFASFGPSVRRSANSLLRYSINLGQRPLSWAMAQVFQRPELSYRINQWLLHRYPALHSQLIAVGRKQGVVVGSAEEIPRSELTVADLTSRARRIYADLQAAIQKCQEQGTAACESRDSRVR